GSLYEGGIRVPTIIRWPGVTTSGTSTRQPISTQDLYPTIMDMVQPEEDHEQLANFDGVSLTPLLKASNEGWQDRNLFWHYPHYYPTTTPVSAIRQGDWKLLEYFEDNRIELYNLKEDIGEENNLEKVHPEKAKELLELLAVWRQEMDAPMPQINPEYSQN
nr:DUF4976 domain-containing protein [Saprospiraceae bacterium]